MAFHEILGVQHRLVLEYVQGAGFVGIAVALMGRSHPVGIILAALLFGLLYQGGTELSFAIRPSSRDMVVVIQGLVILFMGALEQTFRPYLNAVFARRWIEMDFSILPEILSSTIRMSVPLILACIAGLWSERSGIVDIGLEGKMLAAAFMAASVVCLHRLGLDRACRGHLDFGRLLAGAWLCLDQPARQSGDFRAWASTSSRRVLRW